ncbi:hypothetical protein DFQ29_006282, partial [Apophysomyces sp. BC1021]
MTIKNEDELLSSSPPRSDSARKKLGLDLPSPPIYPPPRPRFNTTHSSDAAQFMTLAKLRNKDIKTGQNNNQQQRQLTVETTFFSDAPIFQNNESKRTAVQ